MVDNSAQQFESTISIFRGFHESRRLKGNFHILSFPLVSYFSPSLSHSPHRCYQVSYLCSACTCAEEGPVSRDNLCIARGHSPLRSNPSECPSQFSTVGLGKHSNHARGGRGGCIPCSLDPFAQPLPIFQNSLLKNWQ